MTSAYVRATVAHVRGGGGDLDSVAVAEAIAGRRPRLYPADRREVVRQLTIRNWSAARIAGWIGTTIRAVQRHRTVLSKGDRCETYDWRYMIYGEVVHALRRAGDGPSVSGALCGRFVLPASDWRGTGSQAEYEQAARLPECRLCVAIIRGR